MGDISYPPGDDSGFLTKFREVQGRPNATADDMYASVMAAKPLAATQAPPSVGSLNVVGAEATTFARGDHTHKSSVQRARVSVPLTSGKGTWLFSEPYPIGVIPVIQTTVETPNDPTFVYDAKIVAGTATNTGVQIVVNKFMAAQTLGNSLTALISSVVQIFQPATGTVVVDCWAAPATS